MADVTINNLAEQVPTTSDVFPFSTTGLTPSTYKASLAQIKTGLGLATVATTGSYNDLINIPVGVPVGAVFHLASSTAPTGYLICNGVSVPNGTGTVQGVTTNFSALYAILGSTYGSAGKLPDLRGEFIRGWDSARGIDSGRVFGSSQVDAFQGHRHALVTGHWGANTPNHDSNWLTRVNNINENTRDNYAGDEFNNGVNGTPRTASETRPRNLALLPVIKY